MIKNMVGIIGWPISHSLSPIMHNHAFLKLSLDSWTYVPLPVATSPETRLKEAVFGLRALGFKGANVTVPYKESVIPYLDSLTKEAKNIGAVNTIAVTDEGKLVGHNTDGDGFINDLSEHQITVADKSALILGAGGASRAIAYALLSHGCRHLTILNRTKTKADDVVLKLQENFNKVMIESGQLHKESLVNADLVINTTSIGLNENAPDMPWDEGVAFSKNQVVYDVIYNPKLTRFLQHAQKYKAKAINGLGMLVHQGALSFEIWTGHKAPIESMKQILRTRF